MRIVAGYKKKPFDFRDRLINHTIGLDGLVCKWKMEFLRQRYNLLSAEISLLEEIYDAHTKYRRYSMEQKRAYKRLCAKKQEMMVFKEKIERFKASRVNN